MAGWDCARGWGGGLIGYSLNKIGVKIQFAAMV